jgi:hypothetical protein
MNNENSGPWSTGKLLAVIAVISVLSVLLVRWIIEPDCDWKAVLADIGAIVAWLAAIGLWKVLGDGVDLNRQRFIRHFPSPDYRHERLRRWFDRVAFTLFGALSLVWLMTIVLITDRFWVQACFIH